MVRLTDPRINESSGLAISVSQPDLAYTCNDDDGVLFAIRPSNGDTVGTFDLAGVTFRDSEALAITPDGRLWIADIGDNPKCRDEICLYVLPEPGPGDHHGLAAERFRLTYPTGPRDAESLLIHPITGDVFVISKQKNGKIYRTSAANLDPASVTVLERVDGGLPAHITDACFTCDGRWVLLRQKPIKDQVTVLRAATWEQVGSIPVPAGRHPETIALHPDGHSFYTGSEGRHSPLIHVPLPPEYSPMG